MNGGNWRGEAWPRAAHARERLPRIEDVPSAADGYDRESVRAAFDSFYRHIAQLDSTLRALEAVELFRDQAGELRRELRALKAAGWAQQRADAYAPARMSPGLPEWLPRVAIEAAFLIVVAVVVAVAGFDRLSIVLVMALAWVIVGVVEWAASQDRFARKGGPTPARVGGQQEAALLEVRSAEPAAGDAEPWTARPVEAAADDAHTLVRPGTDEPPPVPSQEPEPVEVPQTELIAEQPVLPPDDEPRPPGDEPELVPPRGRSVRRGRAVLVGLVAIALPVGIAPPALLLARSDGGPTAEPAQVAVRHTPRPRAVGSAAIGYPKREPAPLRTDAVVRASRGDSWVEVRANSPNGREVYSGMLVRGRVVHSRSERVWVRLGAASNVDVRVNGKHVGPLFGTVAVLLTPRGVATG